MKLKNILFLSSVISSLNWFVVIALELICYFLNLRNIYNILPYFASASICVLDCFLFKYFKIVMFKSRVACVSCMFLLNFIFLQIIGFIGGVFIKSKILFELVVDYGFINIGLILLFIVIIIFKFLKYKEHQ